MTSSFRHNKKRNSGLLYEFLVRRIATQMIDKDKIGCAKTVNILKKYYAKGQPLAEEKNLFDVIKNSRSVSNDTAKKILDEVKRHASKINKKILEIKKSNIIKEINYSFGKDFFDVHRIPDYRLLASIHMFLESNNTVLSESIQKFQLEEALVKFMTSSEHNENVDVSKDKIDSLVCTMVAHKFQEKYSKSLNEDQKKLLEQYMISTMCEDTLGLDKHLESERSRVVLSLKRAKIMKEFCEDKIMAERLDEAVVLLNKPCDDVDKKVENLMLYYKLIQEISSDE